MREILDDAEAIPERRERCDRLGQLQVGQRQIDEAGRLILVDAFGLDVVRPEPVALNEEDDPRRRRFAPGFRCEPVQKRLQYNGPGAERDPLQDGASVQAVRCQHWKRGHGGPFYGRESGCDLQGRSGFRRRRWAPPGRGGSHGIVSAGPQFAIGGHISPRPAQRRGNSRLTDGSAVRFFLAGKRLRRPVTARSPSWARFGTGRTPRTAATPAAP
jgi:hypothetical protein